MSRVDLVKLGERLRDFGMDECAASLSLSETLVLADLIEKARELAASGCHDLCKTMRPYDKECTCGCDALAALFDKEGK